MENDHLLSLHTMPHTNKNLHTHNNLLIQLQIPTPTMKNTLSKSPTLPTLTNYSCKGTSATRRTRRSQSPNPRLVTKEAREYASLLWDLCFFQAQLRTGQGLCHDINNYFREAVDVVPEDQYWSLEEWKLWFGDEFEEMYRDIKVFAVNFIMLLFFVKFSFGPG